MAFSLNPFQSKKQAVKIFGERNTSTVYLEWLLNKNLKANLLDYFTLGWKHRLAPSKEELNGVGENILFLCLVKNPYSWLFSLHRRPYKQEELKKLSFSDFIRFPFGDYGNPIQMWNIKNRSYLNLEKHVQDYELIHFEDLLKDPETILNALSERYEIGKTMHWFKSNSRYISNHHGVLERSFPRKYYLTEQWKKELKKEDVQFINQQLDKAVMDDLNYEVI